jgi:hypothetical protein
MPDPKELLKLMKDATSFSDEYREANIDPAHRRAYNAYHSILENEADYITRKRSALFIPKTRDHCRRWKTTITNAFFMSDDLVTLTNSLYPEEARFTNEVVNIRLEKHMPTFQFISRGADAHVVVGNAIGKAGWDYRTEKVSDTSLDGVTTTYESPATDRPFLELVPFENIQYDFRVISEDPVMDSPYWRQWIPMYVGDVKYKFKTKEWKKPKGMDWKVIDVRNTDSVRKARQGKKQDPAQQGFGSDGNDSEYFQVWVVENYFRLAGTDWTFLSLGDEYIVTDPERTVDKFPHRRRPFAMSQFDPEAFRSHSDGLPELFRHLQAEENAIRNQRRDNVNIVLNRGHFVKRGAGVQLQSLLSPRPGMVTLGDDIGEDAIRPMDVMDVTASAYREEEIATRDIEQISMQSANKLGVQTSDRQSATEAAINASASGEQEGFIIKAFVDTFMRPLLTMLVKNIVAMESDREVFNDAALATGLPPDPSMLTDCEVVINAGMGSTNKELRMQRIGVAIDRGIQIAQVDPGFVGSVRELYREMLPLLGLKAVERIVPPTAQQRGAFQNAGGIPAGPPSPGMAAQSPAPGVSPELSQAANQIPALGGFARGILQ